MRGTRLISWSTPKSVQIRKESVSQEEEPKFHSTSKHKNYCKKLKGKHEYGWIERISPLGFVSWWEGRCWACGKRRLLWQKNPRN